ncbi:MAG: DUF3473 domain-containing protein [Alphaproteobacteria bacterium]|nr:MAG: DUF3473 domain-containing protein [Alphaproteobacteria bacterium]
MTVDVEDYFQVQALEPVVDRSRWDEMPRRVERNTHAVLDLFAETGVKGTFFTLGWVAERHPELVRRIVREGHELASHGMSHVRASEQDLPAFRADVRRARAVLEDVAGTPVKGYRAASFSIGEDNLWALDVLAEEGYRYSSSIYPIRHDIYGMPTAPRFAFRPLDGKPFTEVPVTTVEVMGRKIPCGGGGYFRLLPYALSRWAMKRVNESDQQPCIFYFHPWEIDPDQPVQRGLSWKSRFRHYTNLHVMADKLRRVLCDFAWGRMDQIFLKPNP